MPDPSTRADDAQKPVDYAELLLVAEEKRLRENIAAFEQRTNSPSGFEQAHESVVAALARLRALSGAEVAPVEAQTDDDGIAREIALFANTSPLCTGRPGLVTTLLNFATRLALRSRSSSPVGLSEEQIAAINALRHRIRGDNGISDAFSHQHNDALDAVLRALERTNPATRCTCSDPAIIGCPVHDEALR